jgi:hypothetical protein
VTGVPAPVPGDEGSVGVDLTDPGAAALHRAAILEETDWSAAIELLVATNRASRSDEVEIELAALRRRCFDRLAEDSGGERPLTPGTAPPVGESGLPETTLDGLNASDVRAAILGHGSLLVRGAVDAEGVRELVEGIDRSCDAPEGNGKSPGCSDGGPRSAWRSLLAVDAGSAWSLRRKWVQGAGGALLADSPRMLSELLERYEAMGLYSIVSEYLGGRPVLSANKCTLRRVTTDATGGWHQDGAFLGRGIRAINLWLALSRCGVDAPGLDVVARRLDGIVETGTGGSYFDWAVGPEVVRSVAGDAGVVRPVFDAGDLLIFDDLLLHRTAVEEEMTRQRYAIEMWSFAPTAYPSGQVPLVW